MEARGTDCILESRNKYKTEYRKSLRIQGLPPEYGLYTPEPRKKKMPEDTKATVSMPTTSVPIPSTSQLLRIPSAFRGEANQDPGKWLKEYDRVAKYNKWDDSICLANAYFFLEDTAKQWFENNEDHISSWEKFKEELQKVFGDSHIHSRRAEEMLKVRAQRSGESTQSYIQSVLRLCSEVNPAMTEGDKLSHLMKGVAENIYQALLPKEISTVADFIKWCQYIEQMQQKRVKSHKFERLPNVVSTVAVAEQPDLVRLIREIVREEVRSMMTVDPEPEPYSLEAIIKEEVGKALSPAAETNSWTEVSPRRKTSYANAVTRMRPTPQLPQRKTDEWRTEDNRPVCFHCGRPGHVVRYCRERRAVFQEYRSRRRDQTEPRSFDDDFSRSAARRSSPSPTRGRSPIRRYRSPSPYRRSSQSPSRRTEEN